MGDHRKWSSVDEEFVPDSPLEGDGFEPSVPGTKEPIFSCRKRIAGPNGGSKKGCLLCGTDGSNPSLSSAESAGNLTPSIKVGSSAPLPTGGYLEQANGTA